MTQGLGRLLAAALAIGRSRADQCAVPVSSRIDCGVVGTTQDQCEAKGCCWKPDSTANVPWCFQRGSGPAPTSACVLKHNSSVDTPPFSEDEVTKLRGYFLSNIDIGGSGAVVAAPDHNTGPGGDYYFHWERDGALSMHAFLATSASFEEADDKMSDYLSWVEKVQAQPDPHGIDIRTEPKYTIPDGKPFSGAWCRPQTDGPGLRAKTLAEYALLLQKHGKEEKAKEVARLVTRDLAWVVDNWQSNGCDLWEEVRSTDWFWGRYTMRAGLTRGAELAALMSDTASASKYRAVASDIEKTLMGHFDGNFVFEEQNRRKDAAVIEAFNVGDLGDGLFGPLTKEVLGTVITLNELFCRTFDINRKDAAAGVPGILYGRYENDNYDGGNPWVLLTASLARLVYRQASAALSEQMSDTQLDLLKRAYGIDTHLKGTDLADALMGVADGVLLRIKHHTQGVDLHMAEQLLRSDGTPSSAKDLTWNYANLLLATAARKIYVDMRQPGSPTIVV